MFASRSLPLPSAACLPACAYVFVCVCACVRCLNRHRLCDSAHFTTYVEITTTQVFFLLFWSVYYFQIIGCVRVCVCVSMCWALDNMSDVKPLPGKSRYAMLAVVRVVSAALCREELDVSCTTRTHKHMHSTAHARSQRPNDRAFLFLYSIFLPLWCLRMKKKRLWSRLFWSYF